MAQLKKPAILTLKAPIPKGQDGVWETIRRIDVSGAWSISDVDAEMNIPRRTVQDYVHRLHAGGFVILKSLRQKTGRRRAEHLYRLAASPPREAPRLKWNGKPAGPIPAQLMWRAMRTLRDFTVDELAFSASIDKYRVTRSAALAYVRLLTDAGYLRDLGSERYRLIPKMNTGPHYPMRVEVGAVFDRNRMEYVGAGEVLR